jgi:hypothetical protein
MPIRMLDIEDEGHKIYETRQIRVANAYLFEHYR